ncbi:MAG: hypothetical protein EZS28_056626, partial [Streblomastix strix]
QSFTVTKFEYLQSPTAKGEIEEARVLEWGKNWKQNEDEEDESYYQIILLNLHLELLHVLQNGYDSGPDSGTEAGLGFAFIGLVFGITVEEIFFC